ncbi:MAG: hypothetical protein AAF231_08860 [Pseudomonadota bacterium]
MSRSIALSVFFSAALGLFSVPALAQTSGHTTTMDASAQVLEYSFRPYGALKIAAMVTNIGGKTAVCGMWSETERIQAHVRASNLDRRARQTTGVELGNRRLITGVTFMTEVDPDAFKAGVKVPCKVTNVPWEAGFARQKIEFAAPRLRSRS